MEIKTPNYPTFKVASFVGMVLYILFAIVSFFTNEHGLTIGFLGITAAFFTMYVSTFLFESTTNELKGKLKKMDEKLDTIKEMLKKKKVVEK